MITVTALGVITREEESGEMAMQLLPMEMLMMVRVVIQLLPTAMPTIAAAMGIPPSRRHI